MNGQVWLKLTMVKDFCSLAYSIILHILKQENSFKIHPQKKKIKVQNDKQIIRNYTNKLRHTR